MTISDNCNVLQFCKIQYGIPDPRHHSTIYLPKYYRGHIIQSKLFPRLNMKSEEYCLLRCDVISYAGFPKLMVKCRRVVCLPTNISTKTSVSRIQILSLTSLQIQVLVIPKDRLEY